MAGLKPNFSIVFIAPDIPGNTGSIGRTCVALGIRLILIKPYGFDIDEKSVRRAGLDYWKHLDLTEYDSFDDFLLGEKPNRDQLIFIETGSNKNHYEANYSEGCYLIFGSETKGLPRELMAKYRDRMYHLPMYSDKIRSLNLSNCSTAVVYEALRQLSFS